MIGGNRRRPRLIDLPLRGINESSIPHEMKSSPPLKRSFMQDSDGFFFFFFSVITDPVVEEDGGW